MAGVTAGLLFNKKLLLRFAARRAAALRGSAPVAQKLRLALEIGDQIADAPVVLLQETGEIGALGKGKPNALDLDIRHDRMTVGGFAHPKRGFVGLGIR